MTSKLNSLHMSLCEILLSYEMHYYLVIKHVAPILHLSQHVNMLRKFYSVLVPRINVNANFPCVLIAISPNFEGIAMCFVDADVF